MSMTMGRHVDPLPAIEERALRSVREDRPVALFTHPAAWDALNGALDLPVVWRGEPDEATELAFRAFAAAIPAEAEVIYAVGGGLPVDAAKLAASALGLPLVAVPTALSVDAHLTPASGIRRDGCVFYIPTGAPGRLIVDWEVIAAAPPWVRAAGIGDVLSIATGLWDWRFAEDHGRNAPGQHWQPWAASVAEALLAEAIRIAEPAGAGDHAGLARLLDLLAMEVQLCNLIGHSRPEEGSEHAFAYSVENLTGHGLPHGDLVGPGILAMAAAQGQETGALREALLASGARLDQISAPDVEQTLASLGSYVERHDLPFGVAHALDEARFGRAMAAAAGA
jgi:glycerol-1-phosphate dehydrogenase [NAD(P)+]